MVQITTFRCDYCKKVIEPKQFLDNGHPTREPVIVKVDVDAPYSGIDYLFHFHKDCAPQGYAAVAVLMNEIYAGWEKDHLAQMEALAKANAAAAKDKPKIEALGPRTGQGHRHKR